MTSSVTGPDRRPTTEAGRRTGARPGEGAQAFGSALSAELDRDPADQSMRADRQRQQAAQSRTAQQRAHDQAALHRSAANREALSQAESRSVDARLQHRAVQSRDGQHRALQNRISDWARDHHFGFIIEAGF